MIASDELGVALYARLNGAITGGVYDEVPTAAVHPYTVIGETPLERSWDTHDGEGSEEFIMLHVWSKTKGSRQVKQIMAEIDNRLHDFKLILTGGLTTVLMQRDFAQVLKQEVTAGETWRHGVLRYRALITT